MADIEVQSLVDSINHIEAVKILLERLNNETVLSLLRHKTLLETTITACTFLVSTIRTIEIDLRTS